MRHLRQDIRFGARTLARTPAFTVLAITVLALGIGVNAAVFSAANAFFLRPLPVAHPGDIVRVYLNRSSNVPYRTYLELRSRNSTLEALAAFQLRSFALRVESDAEHTFGEIVTGEYFEMLGVPPARGRVLAPDDDRPGAEPVAVLSHAFWVGRFGASPDVVGRTVSLNGQPFTIVGVAPKTFPGILAPLAGNLWVPFSSDALLRPSLEQSARLDTSFHLAGRLKPGVVRAQAQSDLDTIGRQLRAAAGEPERMQPAVTVYGSTMVHPEVSQPITVFTTVLMTVVGLVLLIVCVNVANLVLARAAGRQMELAVRQSLGAGRGRLVRQMLTENLILSVAGAAAGFGLAFFSMRMLSAAQLPTPVPVALDFNVDWRVAVFTVFASTAATLAFGLMPALTASRVDLVSALKATGAIGPRQGRLRSAFLVAQVSMSVLLLVVAGLFIRSFRAAQSIDRGFDATNVLTASIDLETRGYSPSRGIEFVRAATERLQGVPGVLSVNVVDIVPLTLSNTTAALLREGDAAPARGQPPPTPLAYVNAVGPGHFPTLRIPVVAGRDFTDRDVAAAQPVAIVNETLARRFWPGQSAIGQRLRPAHGGAPGRPIEVIGVVRDSKYVTVGEEPRPFLYRPFAQAYTPTVTLLVKTTAPPASVVPAVKQEVRALDPGVSLFNVGTLAEATSISLLPARLAGSLLAALGLLALALAALGIYGVLSYLVRARTREIGVRMAVGATPARVVAMVLREAVAWTISGAAIGLALAAGLTRFLQSMLYGISPTDPWTFAAVVLTLAAVASIAALLPALKAARVDPLVALRSL